MVRNYKRKSTQHSWSEESMAAAISDVRNNILGLKKASERYNVPMTSLQRRVKSTKDALEASVKSLGRFKTTFTQEQEKELADFILDMESRLFGLGTKELRQLAFQFADKNGIQNNFNATKGLAGRDWVIGFLKRQKNISLRLPEFTSAARASAFNKHNVSSFFGLLGELLDKYHFQPSRIFNCDETGISTVPNKPSRIFSLKGKKQVGSLSSAERGTLVTAEICFNAAGFYVPPLLIFPRVRRVPAFVKGLPPESIVECHQSGWMQSDIFANIWFPHFLKYAKPSKEDPILLIFDGHATHTKNLQLVERARSNNVHIIVIPPHTSHRMQPLDVAFMLPLTTYYEQETKNYLISNPGKVVTLHDLAELFGNAFKRAATTQTALNGFKATGICPYNPHIFPEDLFMPSETTDREIETVPDRASPQPGPSSATTWSPRAASQDEPSHSKTPSPNVPGQHASSLSSKTAEESSQNDADQLYYSPRDIMPLPKAGPRKTKRSARRGKTMILTATPNYEELKSYSATKVSSKTKVTAAKRNLSSDKSKKSKKMKQIPIEESSSSDGLSENNLTESSDLEESSDCEFYPKQAEFALENVSKEDINEHDFLWVELTSPAPKNIKKKFVAQVIDNEANNSKKCINVRFLRQYRQSKDVFTFPEVSDESELLMEEILGRLKVKVLRHGKIQVL